MKPKELRNCGRSTVPWVDLCGPLAKRTIWNGHEVSASLIAAIALPRFDAYSGARRVSKLAKQLGYSSPPYTYEEAKRILETLHSRPQRDWPLPETGDTMDPLPLEPKRLKHKNWHERGFSSVGSSSVGRDSVGSSTREGSSVGAEDDHDPDETW